MADVVRLHTALAEMTGRLIYIPRCGAIAAYTSYNGMHSRKRSAAWHLGIPRNLSSCVVCPLTETVQHFF